MNKSWDRFKVGDKVSYEGKGATVSGFSSAEPYKVRIYIKKSAELKMVDAEKCANA